LLIATAAAAASEYINFTDLGVSSVALDLGFFQLRWYSLGYLFGILLGR
jgi:phosphatidylglycerol---prolipoprotein diacylglyceryl transferase